MDVRWHLFETELNWMAGLWSDGALLKLVFGSENPQKVAKQLGVDPSWRQAETDSMKRARSLLPRFSRGQAADLNSIPIALGDRTSFQRKVLEECRRIRHSLHTPIRQS